MFYYLSSLFLNLSPWAFSLLLSSLGRVGRLPLAAAAILCLSLGLWPAGYARSAQVNLQWDPSLDPDVSGYKVYYGKASGSYGASLGVGNTTACTISSLEEGVTYYFAATAVDSTHAESDYSDEIVYTTPGGCAASLSPAGQSFDPAGGSGSAALSAGAGCSWTAVSNASWILLTSNSSGTGSYTIRYSVAANSGSSSRTGTLTVAGRTLTVTQQGLSQYTLTVGKTGTAGGTVTSAPGGTVFNSGTAVTLTAAPDGNAVFQGWSGACTGSSPTCSLTVTSNLSVTASFALKTFTISSSAGSGGSLSPQGQVSVAYGGSQNFSVTPASGYQVRDVKVDGVSLGAVSSYLFGNVMAGHAITASFIALAPAPSSLVLALNAGGPEQADSAGDIYQADRYYTGGTAGGTAAPVRSTRDPVLYQTERYGSFSYAIPLSNGDYDVTLQFVENTYSAKGDRVFSVFLQGHEVIKRLDTYFAAGANTALDFTFRASVSEGVLHLDFVPSVGDAQVSAIKVARASSAPPANPNGKVKKYYSLQQRNAAEAARVPEGGH